jgi:FixJ family two-component response regulator
MSSPWLPGASLFVDDTSDESSFLAASGRTGQLPEIPVISIIDDDESVRIATQRLVKSLGFIGHTFPSAAEFLQSPHVNGTSCVIADVQMPGIGGVELQALLLAKGNVTPMIFITAFPDEGIRARVLENGAIAFLSKPCDGPTLIRCLEAALKAPRADD